MRRMVALCCLATAVGCLPGPATTAPAPLAFHATRPAKEAVQVAAVTLLNAGFRVTQTDSIGQSLTATRTATHNGNQDYVVCDLPRGSAAAANRQTELTINFKATPATSGSEVAVDSRVHTSYPGYEGSAMQPQANDTDCVSNGTMERQLQTVLR
jgi:hypothetical protein